ncbi:pentapeptide repeat-containing protein [Ralstonia syzygii subsp. celebesensis]|uniref:pentapeptide repeat-containing protein n=1 Tax=Ralstonia syzygii TaxID=28097 RepID=UPI000993A791|nr:pentapeptide repeat-containing protein [Ralstonia syzygii subsp. celebesensis]
MADCSGPTTELQGADLTGAQLHGADLRGAKYDDQTKFPIGFDPHASGCIWVATS